jgi:hypothetical protein
MQENIELTSGTVKLIHIERFGYQRRGESAAGFGETRAAAVLTQGILTVYVKDGSELESVGQNAIADRDRLRNAGVPGV